MRAFIVLSCFLLLGCGGERTQSGVVKEKTFQPEFSFWTQTSTGINPQNGQVIIIMPQYIHVDAVYSFVIEDDPSDPDGYSKTHTIEVDEDDYWSCEEGDHYNSNFGCKEN